VKKRIVMFAFALGVIAVSVAAFVTPTHQAKAITAPGIYTFAQAVTNGIIQPTNYGCTSGTTCSPPDTYSFCNPANIDTSGFATLADAQTAAASNDTNYATCVDDPRSTYILTDSPDDQTPDAGATTLDAYEAMNSSKNGWKSAIEAGAPTSPGGHDYDTIRIRLHAIGGSGHWGETGLYWQKQLFSGAETLFSQIDGHNISLHPIYSFTQGHYYNYRVRGFGLNSSIFEWQPSSGPWYPIFADDNVPCALAECDAHIGTKMYCVDSSDCPHQNAPTDQSGTDYGNIQFRSNGTWSTGVPSLAAGHSNNPLFWCQLTSSHFYSPLFPNTCST
jgi:hypothetical protein